MTTAVLALGSNLGDRLGHLRGAVTALGATVRALSGVYESAPWPPGTAGDAYLNAVVVASDDGRDARGWLDRARELERVAGRVRDPRRRYAPRTLDVDVIMVSGPEGPVTSTDPELVLPHPRAHLRAFVLRPWVDVQPYADLPGHGRLSDLLRHGAVAADLRDLRPRPDLELAPAR